MKERISFVHVYLAVYKFQAFKLLRNVKFMIQCVLLFGFVKSKTLEKDQQKKLPSFFVSVLG